MHRTLSAAAATAAAAIAAPARAFDAAPHRLRTFRDAEPGALELVQLGLESAAPFAPLALVVVVALYVVAESRLFASR